MNPSVAFHVDQTRKIFSYQTEWRMKKKAQGSNSMPGYGIVNIPYAENIPLNSCHAILHAFSRHLVSAGKNNSSYAFLTALRIDFYFAPC